MATTTEPPVTVSSQLEDMYNLIGQSPDDEFEIKQSELEQIKVALKNDTFRQMLSSYVEEVRDPENQVTYQSEVKQLERERGNIVHFVNPRGSYVLKTSVDGDKKAFINICSNALIRKPTVENGAQDNKIGTFWSIPYTQSQGREDRDKSGQPCMVYDVIFSPEALKLAKQNTLLQQTLEQTALEAVEKSFSVSLDKVNIRRPKLKYKGLRHAATIKYKIGEEPPHVIDPTQIGKEQPPEKDCPLASSQQSTVNSDQQRNRKKGRRNKNKVAANQKPEPANTELDYSNWTHPKYALKYRSHVDMQNFCTEFQRKNVNANVPDQIVLTANLPLLKDSSTLDADVVDDGDGFELKSDLDALYYLKVKLPYKVHPESAKATFDKDKRQLTVCMNVVKKQPVALETSLQDLSLEDTKTEETKPNCELVQGEDDLDLKNSVDIDSGTESPSLSLQPVLEDPFEESGECKPDVVGSPAEKKTVRFSDEVKRQIYRSNSSILGQRKKNQRKTKSRRKRLNSAESTSSFDEDDDGTTSNGIGLNAGRHRSFSGGSVSSMSDDDFSKYGASY